MLPNTEKHILDILQLYEYAMSVGKSLDYQENCNQFLRLVLKRQSLNACWIIKPIQSHLVCQFSIPNYEITRLKINETIQQFLSDVDDKKSGEFTEFHKSICPIDLHGGYFYIHNLNEEGFLVLYSKSKPIDVHQIDKLSPVISKFSNTLKACRVFKNQQILLKRLERSNQELNEYAHVVSHDLKSPIRNVGTMVSWLEEEYGYQLEGNGLNYLELIHENMANMDRLINDILTYASIDMEYDTFKPVDTQRVIQAVIQHNYIPEHIFIEISKELPTIQANYRQIEQLFQNLINNAIKYNDKEKGTIEIGYTSLEKFHQFYVKDNGIGIAENQHKKIFKTFNKLHNHKDSSGIGLSIVKKIVDTYDGSIWLESEIGKGTTFYFTLSKKIKK